MSRAKQHDELVEVIRAARKPWATNSEHRASQQAQAGAVLAAGYQKPRMVTTADEMDALPDGSAILDRSGDVGQKLSGRWYFPETASMGSSKVAKYGPATVIWEPAV